jgi:hypothetical protein
MNIFIDDMFFADFENQKVYYLHEGKDHAAIFDITNITGGEN